MRIPLCIDLSTTPSSRRWNAGISSSITVLSPEPQSFQTSQYEAAGVRFELTEPFGSAVFKTAPFDRSGTPPRPVFKPLT